MNDRIYIINPPHQGCTGAQVITIDSRPAVKFSDNSIIWVDDFNNFDGFTWQPPTSPRTFTLNGIELPCPVQKDTENLVCMAVGGKHFYFKTVDDWKKVRDAFVDLPTEARDKE